MRFGIGNAGRNTLSVSKIMNNYHTPVLVEEVLDGLNVKSGKRYIDATVGGAGHGVEIIKRGGILLGLDVDRDAVEETRKIFNFQFSLFKEGSEWKIVQGNFRDIERIAKESGFSSVDGVLFDLGVSSYQLDTPGRGFSYRFDAPLDLRLNQGEGESAAAYINKASKEQLYEIFAKFGEEERAGTIADVIVRARRLKPIRTTNDLAAGVETIVPKAVRSATLSRLFQALRIAVNDELNALQKGLAGAVNMLAPGGRLAGISFHSLEDRIIKTFVKRAGLNAVTKAPIRPSDEEIRRNFRSRSAKLRIAENI